MSGRRGQMTCRVQLQAAVLLVHGEDQGPLLQAVLAKSRSRAIAQLRSVQERHDPEGEIAVPIC